MTITITQAMVSSSSSCSSSLLSTAASELESIRCVPLHQAANFPRACRALLYSIEGNDRCFECNSIDVSWASISHGIVLCLQCSGRHRSYGINTSKVRSIDMDAWSHSQVLAMLEGGNAQLRGFFDRHHLGNDNEAMMSKRYRTKAALFYRSNLTNHVERVSKAGTYQGRDASRQKAQTKQQQQQATNDNKENHRQGLESNISPQAVATPCC